MPKEIKTITCLKDLKDVLAEGAAKNPMFVPMLGLAAAMLDRDQTPAVELCEVVKELTEGRPGPSAFDLKEFILAIYNSDKAPVFQSLPKEMALAILVLFLTRVLAEADKIKGLN